jgi:hypothetical protein
MKRVIANQFVELTDQEWNEYQNICKAYDHPPSQRGKDLFLGLFSSNEDGFITALHPPSDRVCSMEVYLFVVSLMVHQHLRNYYEQVNDICKQMKQKMELLDEKIKLLDEKIERQDNGRETDTGATTGG